MTALAEEAPQALYRFFDADGGLLYVGISATPIARLQQHRSDSPWWSQARTITLEHFDTRDAVLEAERMAIQSEGPVHNVHRGMVTRSFYIEGPVWDSAKRLASEEGSNVSQVVRELLERYVRDR